MNALFHLPFTSSHFTLIFHLLFKKCLALNAKLLKIDNCKLIIASEGGLR